MSYRTVVPLLCLLIVAIVGSAFIQSPGRSQTEEQAKAQLKLEKRSQRYGTASRGGEKLTRYGKGMEKRWLPPLPFLDPNKTTQQIALEIESERNTNICNAGLIAIGTVVWKESQMTRDETNIYSVYELMPDEIWKNNQLIPIQPSQPIQFTSPGGLVRYNRERYKANHVSIPLLISKTKYVLFLGYDNTTDDYHTMNEESVYLVQGENILRGDYLKRSAHTMRNEANLGQPTTLDTLRTAVQNAPICK
jgi:hypothetical protein